jgi:hypothetical protein
MNYIGIDPGKSGAIACLSMREPEVFKLDNTERDIWEFLSGLACEGNTQAVIENVHSMPGQGVASSFKFGMSFGMLRGMLIASEMPFELVTPRKWQGYMGCLSGGDKKVTRAKAQELFPKTKVFHWNADALLIAEYARRTYLSED